MEEIYGVKLTPDKSRADIGEDLFRKGANCSQAVIGAFADIVKAHGLDLESLMKLSSSFGGGLARLREVCGAVSGGAMIIGLEKGFDAIQSHDEKKSHYRRITIFADEFSKIRGSYICREILGARRESYEPAERTDEFYKKRPCIACIRSAIEIAEKILKEDAES